MSGHVEAIIIGAGVIGCATAFELAKKGYKTLNIDKQPDAGSGSTSNSCALIRFFYSTYDGVAMSYEGYHYWKDWENYLGVEDERGLARYEERGTIMLKTKGHDHENILRLYEEVGVEYEDWDLETLKEKMPIFDTHAFWPPRQRPATVGAQPTTGGRGARRPLFVQQRGGGDPAGRRPGAGRHAEERARDRRAYRGQRGRAPFLRG